jgi:iron-sulfur cluster assembly protein
MEDTLIQEPQTEAVESPITMTARASEEVRKIMEANTIPDTYGLRVGVKGGGCSGLSYTLGFDADKRDGDKELMIEGIRMFVDAKSLFYLMGVEIDFTDGLNGRGFTFSNPQATKTCGCGSSFGV